MEKIQEKILRLFLYNNNLKFNEIEKQSKIRSNKLAYYLKKLVKENVLKKERDSYLLNKESEYLIPYLDTNISIPPVVLVALKKDKKIFLIKKTKRPYKDKLSLPGGRLILGENINKAVKRIMKKYNINATLKKINSISIEQVKNRSNKIVHSFLLIFVTANTKDEILLTDIEKNKKQIILSDYKLIKKDLNKETKISNIISRT
jgi:ADP-ribose pyrophosphatase YjhB (NUDIX family)